MADMPRPSLIRAKPPPEVAHIERTPAWAAPIAILTTPISSSTCLTMMPAFRACAAIQWRTPVEGLIGYAQENLTPAAPPPMAIAVLPLSTAYRLLVMGSGQPKGLKFEVAL